jgi:hypothetical protein
MFGKFEGALLVSHLLGPEVWKIYDEQDYFYFRPYFFGPEIASFFVYTLEDNFLIASLDTIEELRSFILSHV